MFSIDFGCWVHILDTFTKLAFLFFKKRLPIFFNITNIEYLFIKLVPRNRKSFFFRHFICIMNTEQTSKNFLVFKYKVFELILTVIFVITLNLLRIYIIKLKKRFPIVFSPSKNKEGKTLNFLAQKKLLGRPKLLFTYIKTEKKIKTSKLKS